MAEPIIVDMLAHAIDNPAPSTVMIITGDRDFAYAISILKLRRYRVVLVTLNNAHPSLTSQASLYFDWNTEILDPVAPSAKAMKAGLPTVDESLDRNSITPSVSHKNQVLGSGNSLRKDDTDGHPKFQPSAHMSKLPSAEISSHQEEADPTQSNQTAIPFRGIPLESAQSEQEGHEPPISREDIEDLIQNIQRLSSLRRIPNATLSTPYNPPTNQKNGSPTALPSINAYQKPPLVAETSHTHAVSSGSPSNINNRYQLNSVLSHIPAPPPPHATVVPSVQQPIFGEHSTTHQESPLQRPASAPGLIPFSVDLPVGSPVHVPKLIPIDPLSTSITANNPISTIITNLNPPATIAPSNKPSPKPTLDKISASQPPVPPQNRIMLGVSPSSSQNPLPSPVGTSTKIAPPISIPDELKILAKVLLKYKSNGNLRPLRSALAGEVSRNDTFKKAGVEKFKDYIRLAQQRGLIEVGGQEREAWIALKPKFYGVALS